MDTTASHPKQAPRKSVDEGKHKKHKEHKDKTKSKKEKETSVKKPQEPSTPELIDIDKLKESFEESVKEWSVREIKTLCQTFRLDISSCFEKSDLIGKGP